MTNLAAPYFEAMYDADPDPWGFATQPYELRKYALTVASLPRSRYRSAVEPGCSIGVLSALLAERADRLQSFDPIERAVAAARSRVAGHPGATVVVGALPGHWPEGDHDLVVLSECGYYLSAAALAEVVDRATAGLEPGGHLVAVHWRPDVPEYPMTGDEVHDLLRRHPALHRVVAHEEPMFLLDVFER